MTFEEVHAVGKVALCALPSGAQLRNDPSDGSVHSLPYPAGSTQWREASEYRHPLPPEGWSHYPGCQCRVCEPDAMEPEVAVSR